LQEIKVAESNGDIRILIGGCEIAFHGHAQYNMGQQLQPRTTIVTSGGLKLQCIRNATFSSFINVSTYAANGRR